MNMDGVVNWKSLVSGICSGIVEIQAQVDAYPVMTIFNMAILKLSTYTWHVQKNSITILVLSSKLVEL